MKKIIDILKFYQDIGVEYTKKINLQDKEDIWKNLENEVVNCKKCSLFKERTNPVFGAGNKDARLMFVGEAPGRDEDKQGVPFVGRAGRLLNELLKDVGIDRKEIYIANCLKCRPPNNRDPLSSELKMCFGYLKRQIALIKPKVIVTLGRYSTYELTDEKAAMGQLIGRVFEFGNIKVVPIYHPAYLLRNPKAIDIFTRHLKKVKRLVEE